MLVDPAELDLPPCRTGNKTRHLTKTQRHNTPKYGLLFSAAAHCLPCVRYWHEIQQAPLDSASDNHPEWDVRCYAEWTKAKEGDERFKQEVLDYLDGLNPETETESESQPPPLEYKFTGAPPPPQWPPLTWQTTTWPPCYNCRDHMSPKNGLFYACRKGCVGCVRFWHETVKVPLDSVDDDNPEWNVRKWAEWSANPGKKAVLQYLDQQLDLNQQDGHARPLRAIDWVNQPVESPSVACDTNDGTVIAGAASSASSQSEKMMFNDADL